MHYISTRARVHLAGGGTRATTTDISNTKKQSFVTQKWYLEKARNFLRACIQEKNPCATNIERTRTAVGRRFFRAYCRINSALFSFCRLHCHRQEARRLRLPINANELPETREIAASSSSNTRRVRAAPLPSPVPSRRQGPTIRTSGSLPRTSVIHILLRFIFKAFSYKENRADPSR